MDERVWRRPPLQAGRLMSEAWRLSSGTLTVLWPLWLIDAGLSVAGVHWLRDQLGPNGVPMPQLLGYAAAMTIPGGILFAFGLRTMLGVEAGRWRLDRALVGYLLVSIGWVLAELWPARLMADAAQGGIRDLNLQQLAIYLAGVVAWLAVLWPSVRLMLWQTDLAMGRPDSSPQHSWRAMRGAVWPYVVALVGLSAPFYVIGEIAWPQFFYQFSTVSLAVGVASDLAWNILICGLAASAYRMRSLEAQALEDVFA